MEQLNLFALTKEHYKITKPIRLIELFAGIGAQAKALQNLGVNFTHHRVVEFDVHAINSYNAVHETHFLPTDITKIHATDLDITDTHTYEYILTYSFPCQDISKAGRGKE
jgi:DNA (cytosine-5)-methyltransferase 1